VRLQGRALASGDGAQILAGSSSIRKRGTQAHVLLGIDST